MKISFLCNKLFLKAHANGCNNCQQLPTLLGVVGQQCCIRLPGPKSLTSFKLYITSANKCQHCCGSMQTDATSHNIVGPNNVGCCWPTMLGPFGPLLTCIIFNMLFWLLFIIYLHFCVLYHLNLVDLHCQISICTCI